MRMIEFNYRLWNPRLRSYWDKSFVTLESARAAKKFMAREYVIVMVYYIELKA